MRKHKRLTKGIHQAFFLQVDTAGTLNISDVQETDGAIYTCHAQNSLGRDIWDANVTVMGLYYQCASVRLDFYFL